MSHLFMIMLPNDLSYNSKVMIGLS